MDLPECRDLKKKYDECFGSWFQNIQKVEPIQCETVFQVRRQEELKELESVT